MSDIRKYRNRAYIEVDNHIYEYEFSHTDIKIPYDNLISQIKNKFMDKIAKDLNCNVEDIKFITREKFESIYIELKGEQNETTASL